MNTATHPDAYKCIVLAQRKSPGVVTLSNFKRVQKWDDKEGDGQDGGTTTHKGKKLGQPTATFELMNDPQFPAVDVFAEWELFKILIESTISGPEPVALDIYHPDLAANGYRAVVLREMGGMKWLGPGHATITVVFGEYSPAKKKSGTPAGSKAKSAGGAAGEPFGPPAPDPNAAAKAELEQLLEEANGP